MPRETIKSVFNSWSNALYFDVQPRELGHGIAQVKRISDVMFIDVSRADGRLLGVEVLRPDETATAIIDPSKFTRGSFQTGRVPLRKVKELVVALTSAASTPAELEAAAFTLSELSRRRTRT